MLVGLVAGLVSALCYGVGSVLQARSARTTESAGGVDPRLLVRLVRHAPFVAGLALDAAGFAAQFLALRSAPVFFVQVCQAASLAVTALAAVPLLGARMTGREWTWLAAVIVGLGVLAWSAGPEGHTGAGRGVRYALCAAVVVLGATGVAAARFAEPARSALLGLAAGLGFGVVALSVRVLDGFSPGHLVVDPAAYTVVAAGPLAFLFYATGLQRGAVTLVTAAMVVGETLAPAAVGVFLLGDRTRPGLAPLAVLGFALAVGGAIGLTRFGAPPDERGAA